MKNRLIYINDKVINNNRIINNDKNVTLYIAVLHQLSLNLSSDCLRNA